MPTRRTLPKFSTLPLCTLPVTLTDHPPATPSTHGFTSCATGGRGRTAGRNASILSACGRRPSTARMYRADAERISRETSNGPPHVRWLQRRGPTGEAAAVVDLQSNRSDVLPSLTCT